MLQGLAEHFRDAIGIVIALAIREQLAARRQDINALARQWLVIRPLPTDLPKEFDVGRPRWLGPLITFDFVGRGNEVLGDLLNVRIGPDKLPVEETIVSGTAERMTVHRPEQNGFVFLLRFPPGLAQRGPPANLSPGQLAIFGNDVVVPRIQGFLAQLLSDGRRCREQGGEQKKRLHFRSSLFEGPVLDPIGFKCGFQTVCTFAHSDTRVGSEAGVLVIARRRRVQRERSDEHILCQVIAD